MDVIEGGGLTFSLAVRNMTGSFFHRTQKTEKEPKVLPNCSIPQALIAYSDGSREGADSGPTPLFSLPN